jgi:hypothetical protein
MKKFLFAVLLALVFPMILNAESNGTLVVNSTPSKAVVFIDGQKAGHTPFKSDSIKPGIHQVKVTLKYYQATEQKVELQPGDKKELTVSLNVADFDRKNEKQQLHVGAVLATIAMGGLMYAAVDAGEQRDAAEDNPYTPGAGAQEHANQQVGFSVAAAASAVIAFCCLNEAQKISQLPPAKTGDLRYGKSNVQLSQIVIAPQKDGAFVGVKLEF